MMRNLAQMPGLCVLLIAMGTSVATPLIAAAQVAGGSGTGPGGAVARQGDWPAGVPGYVPPKPGEHPRLLFRKADLPAIKARARTPEGKAIIDRLRFLLDGASGDTMPANFNTNPPVNTGAKGPQQLPAVSTFTMGHAAGYGFLYQLTGEKKHADLARQALDKFLSGTPDRDERYTWTQPGAGLRTGMMMTCVALAYDLAYDGWDEAYRKRIVDEIQNYKHVCVTNGGWEGGKEGLDFAHIANPYYPPTSNHYGSLVGGAATAILAIRGDPGADDKRLGQLQADVEKNIVRVLTEAFGDHGFFSEGPGPSHMAANPSLVTALQTMKVAGGRDFIAPRPNGQWLTLRWAFEVLPGKDGRPCYPCRSPSTYGTEYFQRAGTSDGGEFCQGFGAVPDDKKAALLWTYRSFFEPSEAKEYPERLPKGEKSYDALVYPHRAVLAFINFPLGLEPKNPVEVLGHAYCDTLHGYLAFRNQWKDSDDIIVTAYLKAGPRGYIRNNDVAVKVWGLGLRGSLPSVTGKLAAYEVKPDGSGTFAVEGGVSAAVDFSGASGAPCLVAMTGSDLKSVNGESKAKDGIASSKTTTVTAGTRTVIVMTLQKGPAPEAKPVGDKVTVGGQTISFDGAKIVVAK
jgi:hypothetical protein